MNLNITQDQKVQSLGFVRGYNMEQRAKRNFHTINTNENRKRLKVKDNPVVGIRYQEKKARRLDRRIKMVFTLLTVLAVGIMGYFTVQKRNELIGKRSQYNELVNEVLSKEFKRDRLKAKLENSIDINRIQRYAIEDLGMVYAYDNGSDIHNEMVDDDMSTEENGGNDGSNN